MDYNYYHNDIAQIMEADVDDPLYNSMLPSAITFAENKIYRELDLISTVISDSSKTFTTGNRTLTLPTSPHFVTTQQFNVITPANAATPDQGTRNPLTPVTKEYLDCVWNSATGSGIPTQFAMLDDQTIIVGPWPDQAYPVEIRGTIQPAPLSPTNTTTFLTLYLYDLFQAASMMFMSAYQRDDAQGVGAQMWEGIYSKLSTSVGILEARKKYQAPGWASMSPAPVATPSRGQA